MAAPELLTVVVAEARALAADFLLQSEYGYRATVRTAALASAARVLAVLADEATLWRDRAELAERTLEGRTEAARQRLRAEADARIADEVERRRLAYADEAASERARAERAEARVRDLTEYLRQTALRRDEARARCAALEAELAAGRG